MGFPRTVLPMLLLPTETKNGWLLIIHQESWLEVTYHCCYSAGRQIIATRNDWLRRDRDSPRGLLSLATTVDHRIITLLLHLAASPNGQSVGYTPSWSGCCSLSLRLGAASKKKTDLAKPLLPVQPAPFCAMPIKQNPPLCLDLDQLLKLPNGRPHARTLHYPILQPMRHT